METIKIFKNSLSYPLSDYKKLIILGVLYVISQLTTIISSYGYVNNILTPILGIITIIGSLIIGGYTISVIKKTIDGSDELPDFDWMNNFVIGIKYVIVEFIYFIIPIIIMLIVAVATGTFSSWDIISNNPEMFANSSANALALPTAGGYAVDTLITSIAITTIVGIIVCIIFGLFSVIGTCRLADTNSMKEALNFKKVYRDICSIGWISYIGWIILFIIIVVILGVILGVISAIPYIGIIISMLIVSSFISLFSARAMGLMYKSN